MAAAPDCLFCKIMAGEIPSAEVYADDKVYAFRDINPQAPTHILVIPRDHRRKLTDYSEADSEILGYLLAVTNKIAAQEGLEHFRTVINCGEESGQTVWHLHLHLLGGRVMTWPPG